MIFRLSQKLNNKIKAGKLSGKALDENPYADWSAHLFLAARTQYILMSNTKSMYSCVMYARVSRTTACSWTAPCTPFVNLWEDDGQSFVYQRFIAPASGTVWFAKALNRSVTGSMNELVKCAEVWLADGEMAPYEVGPKLNDFLLSALEQIRSWVREAE